MIFLLLVLLSLAAVLDADCGEGGCCFCDAEGQVIPYGFQANRCYSNYVCKCRFQDDSWTGFCLNGVSEDQVRAQEVGRITTKEKASITDILSVAPTSEPSSSISLEETEKQNSGKIKKDGSVNPSSKESSRKNPIKIKSSSTNTKIQNLDPQGPESLPFSSFAKRQNTKPTSVPLASIVAQQNLDSQGPESLPRVSTVAKQNLDSSSKGSSPVPQAPIVTQQNPNPSSKGSPVIPLPSVVAQQNLNPFSKKSSPVLQASSVAKHNVKPSSKVFSSLPVASTKTQPITKLHISKPLFSSQTLDSTVITKTPFKIKNGEIVSSLIDESIRVSSTKEESTEKLGGCRTCRKVQNHLENLNPFSKKSSPVPQASTAAKLDVKPSSKVYSSLPVASTKTQPITKLHISKPLFSSQTLDSTAIRKTPFKIKNGYAVSSSNDEYIRVSSRKEESTEKLSGCRTCSKVENHFEHDKRRAQFSLARKNCLYRASTAKNLCCAAKENCGKDRECYFYCCNGACSSFYN